MIFVIHYKYLTYVIFEIRHTLHVKDSSHIISIWHWHLPCLRFVRHYKYLTFVMSEIRHTLQISGLCHVWDSSHITWPCHVRDSNSSIWPLSCERFVTHYKYLTFVMSEIRHTLQISGLCHVWDSSHIISILPLSCLRFVAHYLPLPCAIYSTLITNILPLSCARFVTHYKHHPTFDF